MDILLAWSVSSAILSSMLICWLLLLKPFVVFGGVAVAPNANEGVEFPKGEGGVAEGAELPNTDC